MPDPEEKSAPACCWCDVARVLVRLRIGYDLKSLATSLELVAKDEQLEQFPFGVPCQHRKRGFGSEVCLAHYENVHNCTHPYPDICYNSTNAL